MTMLAEQQQLDLLQLSRHRPKCHRICFYWFPCLHFGVTLFKCSFSQDSFNKIVFPFPKFKSSGCHNFKHVIYWVIVIRGAFNYWISTNVFSKLSSFFCTYRILAAFFPQVSLCSYENNRFSTATVADFRYPEFLDAFKWCTINNRVTKNDNFTVLVGERAHVLIIVLTSVV